MIPPSSREIASLSCRCAGVPISYRAHAAFGHSTGKFSLGFRFRGRWFSLAMAPCVCYSGGGRCLGILPRTPEARPPQRAATRWAYLSASWSQTRRGFSNSPLLAFANRRSQAQIGLDRSSHALCCKPAYISRGYRLIQSRIPALAFKTVMLVAGS